MIVVGPAGGADRRRRRRRCRADRLRRRSRCASCARAAAPAATASSCTRATRGAVGARPRSRPRRRQRAARVGRAPDGRPPVATTSRSSTTNVCGSGCDATYGTGSDASMASTPVRASRREAIFLSDGRSRRRRRPPSGARTLAPRDERAHEQPDTRYLSHYRASSVCRSTLRTSRWVSRGERIVDLLEDHQRVGRDRSNRAVGQLSRPAARCRSSSRRPAGWRRSRPGWPPCRAASLRPCPVP